MLVAAGLLAASLVGVEGPKGSEGPEIIYQVKLLEMKGLEWRGAVHSQLATVSRQGTSTVWTAPREAGAKITANAARVLGAPKVTACAQAPAYIAQNTTRNFVTEIGRDADGPVNHASYVAYLPKVERATEGWSAKVSGRRIDQGVLVDVMLEEKQITAVHTVAFNEDLQAQRGDAMQVSFEVPEVCKSEVSGEWLIPNQGVLVVSFGPHTVADSKGKAIACERLVIIEAEEVVVGRFMIGSGVANLPMQGVGFVAGEEAAIPLPILSPFTPSRSLPEPFTAQGLPTSLPPLPMNLSPPTLMPGSSEPCASPQMKGCDNAPVGDPIPSASDRERDNASKQAGFTDEASCCDLRPADEGVVRSGWAPVQGRNLSFRIPLKGSLLNGEVSIEIDARLTPRLSANVPPPPIRPVKGD